MNRRLRRSMREDVAYEAGVYRHEAGHAVVAFAMGIEVLQASFHGSARAPIRACVTTAYLDLPDRPPLAAYQRDYAGRVLRYLAAGAVAEAGASTRLPMPQHDVDACGQVLRALGEAPPLAHPPSFQVAVLDARAILSRETDAMKALEAFFRSAEAKRTQPDSTMVIPGPRVELVIAEAFRGGPLEPVALPRGVSWQTPPSMDVQAPPPN